MASSSSKKVIVQRFDRESLPGFMNSASFQSEPELELLTQSGVLSRIPFNDVKSVFFVRDFGPAEPWSGRRSFLSRPKLDGLWVRLAFRDGDQLEGVIPNNLLQIESAGIQVIPPDGAQRVFAPRAALISVQVLGVVGSLLRPRGKKKPDAREQIGLFEGGDPQ